MKKKGLICFDLDNTLINSERAHVYSYNAALERYGFKPWKFRDVVVLFGMPHFDLIKILSRSNDKKLIYKINKEHDSIFIREGHKFLKIIPGVEVTLKKLKRNYKIAILSNSSHRSIITSLKSSGLNPSLFDLRIGNDDVKHSKPYPDEILKAGKLMHHRADFMVGDSIYDIRAGRRAGVKTIGVLSGRYLKGDLKREGADFVVNKIKQILNIV